MLIGLMGRKGAGKDTAAGMLSAHGFSRLAFADNLYLEVAAAFAVTTHFLSRRETKETPLDRLSLRYCKDPDFISLTVSSEADNGVSEAQVLSSPRSPRWCLQRWGTEYKRVSKRNDRYWIDKLDEKLRLRPRQSNVAISDVRELAEIEYIRSQGGILIRIVNPVIAQKEKEFAAAGDECAQHASELLADHAEVDFEVLNIVGNPKHMQDRIDEVLSTYKEVA